MTEHPDICLPETPSNNPKPFHFSEPDYTTPASEITEKAKEKITQRLQFLYGKAVTKAVMPELLRILKVYCAHKPEVIQKRETCFDPTERFTEKDIILITYGDLLRGEDRSPLTTLARFCDSYLNGTINTLHILPFFPYSSDKGFSIIDFETVDPQLGTWDDIDDLKDRYELMFDGVINHVSSKSRWFQEYLNDNPYYRDFFIAYDTADDLTEDQRKIIFRPRTSDILTPFDTINGRKYLWTTFSEDQIDLNYKNPNVLMRVLEILLTYVRHGADLIRLDAVTYLWSKPGTSCVHLEQTHEVVKLFRDILNVVAPHVAIITETNVPHKDNISYFGNGFDEAQMVYNFALPPLVLYTLYRQDTSVLSEWAANLSPPSDSTTFFNFLDSHDGIGVTPVKDILPSEETAFIVEKAQEYGAFISYKTGQDGQAEPYEINVTWFSALNLDTSDEDDAFQVKRFVASRVIALVLQGVPGIYLHSLIGTPNDIAQVLATQTKRDINRTVIDEGAITEALKDPLSKISRISRELGRLISIRTNQEAFHPNGPQKVFMLSTKVFALLRTSPDGGQHILTITNVSNAACQIEINLSDVGVFEMKWYDLVSGMEWQAENDQLRVTLHPYDTMWLQPMSTNHSKGQEKAGGAASRA